jgi:hypothetical protein
MSHFSGYFEGAPKGQKSLAPIKISLEMAHEVICTQKKIISRIFKISGTLIVIAVVLLFLVYRDFSKDIFCPVFMLCYTYSHNN